MSAFVFSELSKNLPDIIARREVGHYFGGAISSKTLANADSLGIGPSGRFKIGRNVVYPTSSLLDWLKQRSAFSPSGCEEGRGTL